MMITYMQTLGSEGLDEKFIMIYEKYRNLMFYIARGILHDDHLSEDAVHDAFVAVSKNLDKVGNPVSAETRRFVSVIVRNVSFNMLSKRNRETPVEDVASEDYYLSNYYDSSQDEFFSKYSCEEIIEVVRGLPVSLKDPLLLYVAQGMSTKEIATLLNLSLAATHKRIQRARERILIGLREKGEEYEYFTK